MEAVSVAKLCERPPLCHTVYRIERSRRLLFIIPKRLFNSFKLLGNEENQMLILVLPLIHIYPLDKEKYD